MSITDDQAARLDAALTGDILTYTTVTERIAFRTAAERPSYRFGTDAAALQSLLDERGAEAYEAERGWLLLSERVARLLDQQAEEIDSQRETIAQLTADLRRAHARAA